MPLPLLAGLLDRMTGLAAEEHLTAVQTGAMAAGTVAQGDRRRTLARWEGEVNRYLPRSRRRVTAQQRRMEAMAMGFKVGRPEALRKKEQPE